MIILAYGTNKTFSHATRPSGKNYQRYRYAMCVGLCCVNLVKLETAILRIRFPEWSCVCIGQERSMPSQLKWYLLLSESLCVVRCNDSYMQRSPKVPVVLCPPPFYILSSVQLGFCLPTRAPSSPPVTTTKEVDTHSTPGDFSLALPSQLLLL